MRHDSTVACDSLQADSRLIPLTKGKVAIVDAADYEHLSQRRWRYLAGTGPEDKGYAASYIRIARNDRRFVLMHRLIMNAPSDLQVDHVNGNRLDNRRSNLRLATPQQNGFNQASHPGTSSQYHGVAWHKRAKKWQAQIKKSGRYFYLGLFASEIAAAKAFDAAATEMCGEFANLNFPEG